MDALAPQNGTTPEAATGVAPKLTVEKFADGAVTLLKLSGTIDEQFDGKGLAAGLGRVATLILDLADIHRISSFGIREFVDFVQKCGERVGDLYFIELVPRVVDQFNMVANFGGKGRVYSFYAPYRCDYCDDERRRLLQVDRDADVVKNQRPLEYECKTCGNPEYFDGDPPSFFHFLVGQPRFDLPAPVASFLAERLRYAVADGGKKLRVDKEVSGRATFLRFGGDLDKTFPRDKLADGLEGDVILDVTPLGRIEPAGAAEWRSFLTQVAPTTERLFLVGCSPGFLDKLTSSEDLAGKAQILSITLPYGCPKCSLSAGRIVDVVEHYDLLRMKTVPPMKCKECGGAVVCGATEALLTKVQGLPRPVADEGIVKFVREAQVRLGSRTTPALGVPLVSSITAGSDVLVAAVERLRTSTPGLLPVTTMPPSRTMQIVLGLTVLVVLALGGFVAWNYRHPRAGSGSGAAGGVLATGRLLERSPDPEPTWATQPFGRQGATIFFTGSSLPSMDPTEAEAEADDAALEEIANYAANQISDPRWIQHVKRQYDEVRDGELTAVTKAQTDQDVARYDAAVRNVREGRHRVALALRHTAAGLLPAARSASYSEKHDTARGIRYRVVSEMTLPSSSVDALVKLYGATEDGAGATVVTYIPELSWLDDLQGGAVVIGLGSDSTLRTRGVLEGSIVTSVQGSDVVDAAGFASLVADAKSSLEKTGGTFVMKAKEGQGPLVEYSIPIAPPAPTVVYVPVGGSSPSKGPPHVGNIFDDDPNR